MALCLILTWMYNDLGGADQHFLVRNGINSFAYYLYGSGALRVAAGGQPQLHATKAFEWLAIVAGVIFTTMHVQDLKDQEGDRARNRSTAPLDLGDGVSRWSILASVAVWSIVCPCYWSLGPIGFAPPVLLSVMVVYRVVWYREAVADALTYKWWSLWLVGVFSLPLAAAYR